MKKPIVCVTAILLLVTAGAPAVAAETAEQQIELRWALGAQDAEGETPSAVHKDSRVETGTRLKFLLEPLSAGSVYLILLDSNDDIHVLYRETTEVYDGKAYVPPGRQWFEVDDPPGRETFFLLASVDPLNELDRLLEQHDQAGGSADSAELSDAIVAEIRRVQKANRNFSKPVEKPVMIGGRTRDANSDALDQLATQVTAEKFFGKTITIDH
jgi:hypothetical protein